MAESNQDGRNQKLVIDYLEALLSDSDIEDSIINVEDELSKTAQPSTSEAIVSEEIVSEGSNTDELNVDESNETEQDTTVNASLNDSLSNETTDIATENTAQSVDEVEVVDLQEEWAEIEAEQADEFLAESLSSDLDEVVSLNEESVVGVEVDEFALSEQELPVQELEIGDQQETSEFTEIDPVDEAEIAEEVEQEQSINSVEDDDSSESSQENTEDLVQALESESAQENVSDAVVGDIEVACDSLEASDESVTENIEVSDVIIEPEQHLEEDPEAAQNAEMIAQEIEEASVRTDIVDSLNDDVEIEKPVELSINCIIVLMYGLKLAIPFEQFEGHIKLSNVTLSLDNDRDWILGDFTSSTMRTHVVDTAQMLFGDNYDALNSNYNEMLVLEGKHWSIVFDKVIKTQNILLSDVTENPSPQFRPWLTGTYMPEKCALVNVSAMVKMFEDELNGSSGS